MSNARISRLAVRVVHAHAMLLAALLALPITNAHAANETITWGFSPTPASVSIKVGETVTWNGNLNFHPLIQTNASSTISRVSTPACAVFTE